MVKDGDLLSGGGRFSGRMTAPICIAGGIAKGLLEEHGIKLEHILLKLVGLVPYHIKIKISNMKILKRHIVKIFPYYQIVIAK